MYHKMMLSFRPMYWRVWVFEGKVHKLKPWMGVLPSRQPSVISPPAQTPAIKHLQGTVKLMLGGSGGAP